MVTAAGIASASYFNEQVAPSHTTEYYVAHLLLLPDEPGPGQVTPFQFVSIDLCEMATYLRVILDTAPSLHGYARNFHGYNFLAANLHRFSYFLIPCYAKNFTNEYSDAFGRYLAKVAYIDGRVPLKLLDTLGDYRVPPFVIASAREHLDRAKALKLPCSSLRDVTPKLLNDHIGRCFSTAAPALNSSQRERLKQGEQIYIPPNVLVATFPQRFVFGESDLFPSPTSLLRLLFPNEALGNQLRRRFMPAPPRDQPDHSQNLQRAIELLRTILSQNLSDVMLEDPAEWITNLAQSPTLRAALEQYVKESTAEAYEALISQTKEHLLEYPGATSYILCCPSVNKVGSERVLKKVLPDRVVKMAYKSRADNYLSYVNQEDFRSKEEFEAYLALMKFQALENEYLSTVLALYATSYRKPVLRTPQLGSALFGQLRHLRTVYDGGNRRAFTRDVKKFSKALCESLPKEVQTFLASTPSFHLKLISDLPLEWLALEGVPLMFDHIVSRVPLTPGNALFAHLNECREDLRMAPEDAQRVLIANCLSPEDRLYRYPKIFAETLHDIGFRPEYVEPTNREQYLGALNDHKPFILAHWGHGFYERTLNRGYLHIRRERTEIWDFRGTCIPPIVLLAACDTAAFSETHNTPANGWLALGARSVLATYFPIQADLTTVLYARIFANLLEAVQGKERPDTWAFVASKTLYLNRYLDFFYDFHEWCSGRKIPGPPSEVFLEYTHLWNSEQTSLTEGYRSCPELLARAIDRFDKGIGKTFREFVQTEKTVPHTMFFSHLGAPETTLIGKDPKPVGPEEVVAQYWKKRSSDLE
ncbi:MAG: hypothetical protein WCA00_17065 [Candidatus Acidiferrales bacterium]